MTGAVAAIEFGVGRRPESRTLVRMATFDGPLALLLSLIEARRLDILTVPLGGLADAYLDALAGLEVDRLGHISSFVAVASQLILIKSRALLPRREAVAPPGALAEEEPDPEAELRARLLVYRAHRDAGKRLAAEAVDRVGLFRREPGGRKAAARAGLEPDAGPPVDPVVLARALGNLVRLVPELATPPEALPSMITLGERAEVIRAALRGAGTVVLQALLRGVHDKVVVAVTFLAMLELVKRREIVVAQAEPWGPIVVRETTAEERAAAGLGPDGASSEPIDESMAGFA